MLPQTHAHLYETTPPMLFKLYVTETVLFLFQYSFGFFIKPSFLKNIKIFFFVHCQSLLFYNPIFTMSSKIQWCPQESRPNLGAWLSLRLPFQVLLRNSSLPTYQHHSPIYAHICSSSLGSAWLNPFHFSGFRSSTWPASQHFPEGSLCVLLVSFDTLSSYFVFQLLLVKKPCPSLLYILPQITT